MGKKSPPPAPDYASLAQQQAASSKDITTQQTWANRPNLNTPWGSQTWSSQQATDPSTGLPIDQWTSNISLSPDQQQALDAQQAIQMGRSQGAQTLLGQAISSFQQPSDWGSLPQRMGTMNAPQIGGFYGQNVNPNLPNSMAPEFGQMQMGGYIDQGQYQPTYLQNHLGPTQNIQGQMTQTPGDWRQQAQSAVEQLQRPDLNLHREQVENQLANQGITQGSEAWNNAQRQLGDYENRANLMAIQSGRDEAQQMFSHDLAAGQFANQAQSQQFGQNLVAGQFGNQAVDEQARLALQQGQQLFGQTAMNSAQNQAAEGQTWQQNLGGAGFENQAAQNQFQNQMGMAGFRTKQDELNFQQQLQSGQFNSQNRQQALAEMMMRRSQPLNELNALLTGQQVNNPQMPSFSQATKSETPQLLNAGQAQYQAGLNNFNASQAAMGSTMKGLFDLGSGAMSGGGWSGLFSW